MNPDLTPAQEPEVTPVRLLLVDDEPGLRTAVKAYLEDEGFAVTTANDGEEGWAVAQEMLPDVILSDVMMPRLDGYGLLQKLRADERLGGTPVIFLTAKGSNELIKFGHDQVEAGHEQKHRKGHDPKIPTVTAFHAAKLR